MFWAGVIGGFTGAFLANIVILAFIWKVLLPKMKKRLNPFGGLDQDA